MCECVLPVHLIALSSGHNNNCSIICVHVRQNESVFNQEDRKTEATENYRICFHRRDNYQIKQIPLIKQLTHRSNQQPGQRQQHLEMWRWSTFRVAAQIRGRIVSSFWSLTFGMQKGNATQFTNSTLESWLSSTHFQSSVSFLYSRFTFQCCNETTVDYFFLLNPKDGQFFIQVSQAAFVWPGQGIGSATLMATSLIFELQESKLSAKTSVC